MDSTTLQPTISENTTKRWFMIFAGLQLFFWTLVPFLVRADLPLDVMEGLTWGHQWQLGYDKNPFMNAWLTEIAALIGGKSGWLIYLFSQISIVICFWAVWKLARKMLNPAQALIAVLLLTGVYYFNLASPQFNDNVIELSLWALIALYFYDAVKTQSLKAWIAVGVFSGLAMMTKYFAVMLFLPMFLFLLIDSEHRRSFACKGLYICIAIFVAMVLPHFIWLSQHHYITLNYAVHRTHNHHPALLDHLHNPFKFGMEQLAAFIPSVIMFLFLGVFKREKSTLKSYDKLFLGFIGLGPFLSVLAFSLLTGSRLQPMWGVPLLTFFGILLVAWWRPQITAKAFKRFLIAVLTIFFLVLAYEGFSTWYAPYLGKHSTAIFPGKRIAQTVSQDWQQRYHRPLKYVAGKRWIAGNIAFYTTSRPQVFMDWNPIISTWINEKSMRKDGAVFVWNASKGGLPVTIKQQYPHLIIVTKPLLFPYATHAKLAAFKLGVAFLPPR